MSGDYSQVTPQMIDAGAHLLQRRTDLDKYSRRHVAEDIFKVMTRRGSGK